MSRHLTLFAAAAALVAVAGCGNDKNPLAPNSEGQPNSTTETKTTTTGLVTVVHGVPGLTVDVYVNGSLTLPSFAPGTVTDPLELPENTYDIVIVPEGGTYPDDGVITGSAFLPAGANASIVAHLAEDGTPSLSVFVNDVSNTTGIRSRVVVRHVAQAPTVDVRLFRKILPWYPVRTIEDLSNPNEAQTEVFPGRLRAKLYPANNSTAVFTSPYLPFYPRESTIIYAVGSLADGTFGLLVQKINLNGNAKSLGSGTEFPSDLTLDKYDAMAVEKGLDALP